MESFFSLLQKNVLDSRRWRTRAELRLAIVSWIETEYHRKRHQRALGKLTQPSLRPSTPPQQRPENSHPGVNRSLGRPALAYVGIRVRLLPTPT